jgi:hypothetical protein
VTITGDLIIGNAANSSTRLPIGTVSQILTSNGTTATWATLVNGGLKLYAENPSTPTVPVATGANSIALGNGSVALNTGTIAYASGFTSAAGDAQKIEAVLRNTTANATATELYINGTTATQRLVLPNNSAWTVDVKIVARRTDAAGTLGSWQYYGLIYRDGTSSTTTMAGTNAAKTTIARIGSITSANDPVITADNVNGSLKIMVTGIAAQTIKWVASVNLVQVIN